jgi:hypothetical protein
MVIRKGMRFEFEPEGPAAARKSGADRRCRQSRTVCGPVRGRRSCAVRRPRRRSAGRPAACRTAASVAQPPRHAPPAGPFQTTAATPARRRKGSRKGPAGSRRPLPMRRVRQTPPLRPRAAGDSAAGRRRRRSRHIQGELPAEPARRRSGHDRRRPARHCAWPAAGAHHRPPKQGEEGRHRTHLTRQLHRSRD